MLLATLRIFFLQKYRKSYACFHWIALHFAGGLQFYPRTNLALIWLQFIKEATAKFSAIMSLPFGIWMFIVALGLRKEQEGITYWGFLDILFTMKKNVRKSTFVMIFLQTFDIFMPFVTKITI